MGLAQAILHQPKLLILDEPTIGLDPTQIVEIRHLIRRLAEHSTILFSTHILSEVEALCDRVIILMNGEVKADARLAELAATSDAVLVLAAARCPMPSRCCSRLDQARDVEHLQQPDGYPAYRVSRKPDAGEWLDVPPSTSWRGEQDWPVRELRRDVRTLETVFNELALAAANAETGGGGSTDSDRQQMTHDNRHWPSRAKSCAATLARRWRSSSSAPSWSATLFSFFWVETFFARGIADVRPLFRWMPVLMIFLVAALTMRQWSEEQRSGTLEMLLTLPVSTVQLVLGKFLAVHGPGRRWRWR